MKIIDKGAVAVRISGSLETAVIAGRATAAGAIGTGGQPFLPASGPTASQAADHGAIRTDADLNRNRSALARLLQVETGPKILWAARPSAMSEALTGLSACSWPGLDPNLNTGD